MEKWAIVELFGHEEVSGRIHVGRDEKGEMPMFVIDAPNPYEWVPRGSCMVGRNAVFRITFCDKRTAMARREKQIGHSGSFKHHRRWFESVYTGRAHPDDPPF